MIEVWTWPTPNGHKVHIALEELEHRPTRSSRSRSAKGDQFKPEFLAITPNHRIPAIVDPDGPGGKPLKLFESAAIMIYLSEKSGGKLIPKDPVGRYLCLQWMMFQMGGTGPMFGQYHHFANYAVQKIPYAIERYTNEVRRLHRVLDKRLAEATWLAGDEYSMADIINFPWIRNPEKRKVEPRRLSEREALARCGSCASGRAARRRGAGGKAPPRPDDRCRTRSHVRQDAVCGEVSRDTARRAYWRIRGAKLKTPGWMDRQVQRDYGAPASRRLTIQHPTDDTTSPTTVSADRRSSSNAHAISAAVPGTR